MNNYSYVTILLDDSYIYGIILLQESLKAVESEYPLEVLITSNVSPAILNVLDQLELHYTSVDKIIRQDIIDYNKKINPLFTKNWALCLTKIQLWAQTHFTKIVYLDNDIMVLKNLDHLFNSPHMTSALDGEYFNIWPQDPHFNAGILVIEPNEEEYKKLYEYIMNFSLENWNKGICIADQELLNLFYSDWLEKTELHLNKYYDIFAPYIQEDQIKDIEENSYFIHFIGRKPWRAFNKSPEETYTEKFYQDAFNTIQTKVNTLDWNQTKEKIKLAIYSICKDEINKVKDFIECFISADYLCILDTGSTDGTWEYLQEAKEKYSNLIIEQKIISPWRYDEARNYSLTLVPEDTTIYFMMDLDEIIKDENWVDAIKNSWHPLFSRGVYTYNRQVDPVSGTVTQQFHEFRIHNNSWHYKGLVHEQLMNIADNRIFFDDECIKAPITVWHYPSNPNREIYIELCEKEVEEEPLNWLIHLQLAAEYEIHEHYEQAITEYRKIIAEQEGLSPIEVGRCYASLGRILGVLNKEEEALAVLQKGITYVPDCGDCYFFAAEILYRQNKFKEASDWCEKGLKNRGENQWCTIIANTSYFPYLIMGISQFNLGNEVLAVGYLSMAKELSNIEETNNAYNEVINAIFNRR